MSKKSNKEATKSPAQKRASAVERLLHSARFIRVRGNPEEAAEAVVWEQQLEKRLKEIGAGQLAAAA